MPLESLGGEDIGKSKHPQRSDKFWRTIQELVSYSTRRDMTWSNLLDTKTSIGQRPKPPNPADARRASPELL